MSPDPANPHYQWTVEHSCRFRRIPIQHSLTQLYFIDTRAATNEIENDKSKNDLLRKSEPVLIEEERKQRRNAQENQIIKQSNTVGRRSNRERGMVSR